MKPVVRSAAVLWLALLALLPFKARAASPWRAEGLERDGILIESRDVPESQLPELRFTARAKVSPLALTEAAWELREDGVQAAYLEKREVLRQAPDQRLIYLRVRPPIVGARACVLRQTRDLDERSGNWRVAFRPVKILPGDGATPFAQLRGEWRFEPDREGGTRVIYTTLIDIGGVPALFARGAQRDAALATVREIIARAAAL
jgi:hypothetical protein